jgi:hypothetical protein
MHIDDDERRLDWGRKVPLHKLHHQGHADWKDRRMGDACKGLRDGALHRSGASFVASDFCGASGALPRIYIHFSCDT